MGTSVLFMRHATSLSVSVLPPQQNVRVHSSNDIRLSPGIRKLGVFWERTYAEIAQNRTKSPKVASYRARNNYLVLAACVPGSEYYLKSALVLDQVMLKTFVVVRG